MDLLTKKEVSELLRCSEKTINYYVTSRQIPFVMIGKNTMFIKSSIMTWLDEREQKITFKLTQGI
tara:strand:- start:8 stop:202 length:195 start_codon:yes stop_codon:yes gene_type:complete